MKRNREVHIIVDSLLSNNVIQEKDAEKAGVAVEAAMKTIRSERYARKVIERFCIYLKTIKAKTKYGWMEKG